MTGIGNSDTAIGDLVRQLAAQQGIEGDDVEATLHFKDGSVEAIVSRRQEQREVDPDTVSSVHFAKGATSGS